MKASKRITPEEAGSSEMWLVMIGFAVAFIIAVLYGSLVIAIAVMFIGAGIFLGTFLHLRSKYSRLSKQSQAKILGRQAEIEADRYSDEGHIYWVVFQFNSDEGRQVTLRARVIEPVYESVEPGATLAVRYHATDPRIALLEGEYGFDKAAVV